MVTQMTNRLLATVVAIALSSVVAAHAAQEKLVQVAGLTHLRLPAVPAVVQTLTVALLQPDQGTIKAADQPSPAANKSTATRPTTTTKPSTSQALKAQTSSKPAAKTTTAGNGGGNNQQQGQHGSKKQSDKKGGDGGHGD